MIAKTWMSLPFWREAQSLRRRAVKLSTIEVLECRTLLAFDLGSSLSDTRPLLQDDRSEDVAESPEVQAADQSITPHVTSNTATYGVTFPEGVRVGQLSVPVSVVVTHLTAGTYLDGWIDWNGDGSWNGAAEHVAAHVSIITGNSTLRVDVPAWAQSGTTMARFQLSTTAVPNDELRNFQFTIQPPVSPSGLFGASIPIDTSAAMQFTSTADLDRDGDLDVLAATFDGSGIIAWYENNGNEGFTRHILTTAFADATCVLVADMNHDGYLDIVASSLGMSTISWFENNGHQQFTLHLITNFALNASNLFVADVDGDGDEDVVYSAKGSGTVGWYENGMGQIFTRHIVATGLAAPCSVSAADFDGDLDLVSGSFSDNTIAWYQNNGSQTFTKHIITSGAVGLRGMFVADLDHDGDPDVLSSSLHDSKIAWFENSNGTFIRHTISSNASAACAVYVGDMDGDGDLDVVGASRGNTTIAWFENTGGVNFPRHVITNTLDQSRGVITADLDGDGDLDVISASQYGNRLAWYQNRPAPLAMTLSSAAPAVTNLPRIPVAVTFNRLVSGLTPASFVLVNGHIANFQGSGSTYSFDLIPDKEGTVSVALPANSVQDSGNSGNPAAIVTRQYSVASPRLTTTDIVATFVSKGAPISIVPNVIVTGSQLGNGMLVIIVPSIKSAKSRFDVLNDDALHAVGTLTHTIGSDKRVTYVALFPGTTAADIQTALRNLSFSTSKVGLTVASRQIQIQLTDSAGQAGRTLIQTVSIQK